MPAQQQPTEGGGGSDVHFSTRYWKSLVANLVAIISLFVTFLVASWCVTLCGGGDGGLRKKRIEMDEEEEN